MEWMIGDWGLLLHFGGAPSQYHWLPELERNKIISVGTFQRLLASYQACMRHIALHQYHYVKGLKKVTLQNSLR